MEELSTVELRDRVASGTTTVLIPIGGTEQNGPHMVLGKQIIDNGRLRSAASRTLLEITIE